MTPAPLRFRFPALTLHRVILAPALPGALAEALDRRYVECVTDTAICPGEPGWGFGGFFDPLRVSA